jgi:hypothetical protein
MARNADDWLKDDSLTECFDRYDGLPMARNEVHRTFLSKKSSLSDRTDYNNAVALLN